MKLISITMVKDECDIIELFIRINSKVIDKFYIINNGCSDTTIQILNNLKKENFNIVIYNDPNVDYQQAALTNKALKTAYIKEPFDWAFVLDADEFLDVKRKELEYQLSSVPTGMIPSVEWRTWVPKTINYDKYNAPLWGNFQMKLKENQVYDKIIFPGTMIQDHFVGEGNHTVYRYASPFDSTPINLQKYVLKEVPLNHFPVRSPIQILTKILVGSHKLYIKKNRQPTDGYHWDSIANSIRAVNYTIDENFLKKLAHEYAVKPNHRQEIDITVDENKKFGVQYDTIKYKELSRINDLARYDSFMRILANTIKALLK